MPNVEIENDLQFKKWKLVSFKKTIKIGLFGRKNNKLA